MKKLVIFAVATLLVLFFVAAAMRHFTPESYAKDGTYYSRVGKFQLPIPVKEATGGRTNEKEFSVSFINDFCSLYRIDYTRSDNSVTNGINDLGLEQYLRDAIENYYLKKFLKPRMTDLTIDFIEYIGEKDNGALYVQLDTPKGSVCTISINGGPPTREDAKRGLLATVIGKRLYIVTTCLGKFPFVGNGAKESDSEADIRKKLQENTIAFASTITYQN